MCSRFSLFFGLIALLTAALPQGAHAGTPVPQTYSCGAGSFLVGLQGHTGNWIDSFQPVCAPWDPVHQRLGPQVPGPTFGNINGGSPNLTSAICPPDSAIWSTNYERTLPNGPPGHVQYLRIACQNIITGDNAMPKQSNGYATSDFILGPDDPYSDNYRNEGNDFCPGFAEAPVAAYGLIIDLDGINISGVTLECDKKKNIEAAAGPVPVHITAEEAERAHKAFSAPAPVHTTPQEALRARVALNQPPASAPVPGSWFQSCSSASLYQNILTASCKSTTGLDVTTSLDLTTCNKPVAAANINGKLECESAVAGSTPPPSPSHGAGRFRRPPR